jgi:hypothetical protein
MPATLRGFVHGLRRRRAVRNAELSRLYRLNFETFVSPLRLGRPPRQLVRALPVETARRVLFRERPAKVAGYPERFFAERRDVYPDAPALLDFAGSGSNGAGRARARRVRG